MSVRQPEIWTRNRPQQKSQKTSRLTPAQRQQIIEQEWKEEKAETILSTKAPNHNP